MDFSFTEDQLLLRATVRSILDDHCSPAIVRAHIDNRTVASEVWSRLSDFAAVGDGDCTDVCIVIDEIGYASAPGPFTATMLALPLLRMLNHPSADAVGSGFETASVAIGTHLIPDADLANYIVIVSEGMATVISAVDAELVEVRSVDHTRRWFRLATPPNAASHRVDENLMMAWHDRSYAIAAAELVGTARRMFDMSLQYAKDREQFGQPIGAFQAIQHKLADMALAAERSVAAVQYASMTIDAQHPERSRACHSAKSAANECAQRILKDSIQIHGGVGFTWEHDLQMYLRRATMGVTQFGTTSWHLDRIAEVLFVG